MLMTLSQGESYIIFVTVMGFMYSFLEILQ